ncbi:MAG TPA: hypothetical protein VFN71_06205, partial [Methylomirabilota bacterium]|nr:hypothetical protein [Methylomirabilota bacterium]
FRRLFGPIRLAYAPVLITYFAYGASGVTGIALTFFQKDALGITPAEAAFIGFWVALPWSTKMVVGVASDVHPILGSRRVSYLVLGALCALAGYGWLATAVHTKGAFLASMVIIAVGFMIQDVVADALSVEVADTDEEVAQVQTLGRMALLGGAILAGGYVGGWLAGAIKPRGVFAVAMVLPALVIVGACFVRSGARGRASEAAAIHVEDAQGPLGSGKAHLVLGVGLGYAALAVALEVLLVPFAQELILVISGVLICVLLTRMGISRAVAISALAIFCFRATPGVGQGYTYWAIDRLGFDEEFLGILSQVSAVVGLIGLIIFRKPIVKRPVSFTLFWVTVLGGVLFLPTIGLFYGANEWVGLTPRQFAFIDTTIAAPLGQLSMVPMLVLIAKTAPKGAEATMFAIMASLMNLALSASELGTRYLNTAFAVSQQDYSNLGKLMMAVAGLTLIPLLILPLLRREEAVRVPAPGAAVAGAPTAGSAL